ncbi:MAG: glutamyl-tRNA reductase [Phycisphaeraceae bacterium]
MRIGLLGLNHRTAPIELRERVAMSEDALGALHEEMGRRFPTAEHVVLSTCNRIECYVARPSDDPPTIDALRALLAECAGVPTSELTAASIHREQEEALRHLFRVAAGLDSMVLGEPQVLGQVKRAYDLAVAHDSVGPVLHRVFQDALAAAKRVRTDTGIGSARVSVGSVAVDFARQVFEDFTDKTILGIGAGEMAKTTLRHLLDLQPRRLWLTNRSPQRAAELASALGLAGAAGGARHWEELDELLVEADVVLTSTGSEQPIVTPERFKPIAKRRRHRPLFIIDIAVPRDVAPAVGTARNVYLYNIDDLQTVMDAGADQRREQSAACEAQLNEAASACMHQVRYRDVGHLIRQLRQRLHDLGALEQQRTQRKLRQVADPETAEAINDLLDEHTRRLVNKILHLPLSQLDPKNGELDAPLGFYAAALRRLFDLDEREHETPPSTRPPAPAREGCDHPTSP